MGSLKQKRKPHFPGPSIKVAKRERLFIPVWTEVNSTQALPSAFSTEIRQSWSANVLHRSLHIALVAGGIFAATYFTGGEADVVVVRDGQSIQVRGRPVPLADLELFTNQLPKIELQRDHYIATQSSSADTLK